MTTTSKPARTRAIMIRVSPRDHRRIRKAASEEQRTIAEFCRLGALALVAQVEEPRACRNCDAPTDGDTLCAPCRAEIREGENE